MPTSVVGFWLTVEKRAADIQPLPTPQKELPEFAALPKLVELSVAAIKEKELPEFAALPKLIILSAEFTDTDIWLTVEARKAMFSCWRHKR